MHKTQSPIPKENVIITTAYGHSHSRYVNTTQKLAAFHHKKLRLLRALCLPPIPYALVICRILCGTIGKTSMRSQYCASHLSTELQTELQDPIFQSSLSHNSWGVILVSGEKIDIEKTDQGLLLMIENFHDIVP